jgi:hypothetical protein
MNGKNASQRIESFHESMPESGFLQGVEIQSLNTEEAALTD